MRKGEYDFEKKADEALPGAVMLFLVGLFCVAYTIAELVAKPLFDLLEKWFV